MVSKYFRGHWTEQGKRKAECPYCGYEWTSKRVRDPINCPKCHKCWYPDKALMDPRRYCGYGIPKRILEKK